MAKMRPIKQVFVHCTDSDDSLDIGFNEIDQWHKERGFLSPSGISCGYHYIIRRDGSVQRGRPDEESGAHVKGRNKASIGIVWVGRKEITPKQYRALLALVTHVRRKYNVRIEDVLGHGEVDHLKTCPNINMLKFRGDLLFTRADDPEISRLIEEIKRRT